MWNSIICPAGNVGGQNYNGEASDIWSCEIILYAILCGSLPFTESKEEIIVRKIKMHDYSIPKYLSKEAQDILSHILKINPEERFTIEGIKKHPWFNLVKPHLIKGISINEVKIPVDENILNMVKDFGFDKEECRNLLLNNKFCSLTSIYYLCLKKYVREGGKSISDLESDLYEEYINNPKNYINQTSKENNIKNKENKKERVKNVNKNNNTNGKNVNNIANKNNIKNKNNLKDKNQNQNPKYIEESKIKENITKNKENENINNIDKNKKINSNKDSFVKTERINNNKSNNNGIINNKKKTNIILNKKEQKNLSIKNKQSISNQRKTKEINITKNENKKNIISNNNIDNKQNNKINNNILIQDKKSKIDNGKIQQQIIIKNNNNNGSIQINSPSNKKSAHNNINNEQSNFNKIIIKKNLINEGQNTQQKN